ncbi:unnamed protein product [Trichobilharzia szidati]|nr:unnamed protein product [Trichobilharzia szidati]
MTESKNSTDINELLPPSLAAVRDIFAEFNVAEVSDEICTRVLDVLYRHTCDVIEEAKAVSHHAGRSKIEEDDIQLAINSVTEGLMFAPPYKDQLLAYAEKNEQPLPAIRPHCGIRLPADRFNLTAPNYTLASAAENGKVVRLINFLLNFMFLHFYLIRFSHNNHPIRLWVIGSNSIH